MFLEVYGKRSKIGTPCCLNNAKWLGWRVWANRFVLVTRFPIGVRSYGHADVALGCWPLASVVLSLSRRGSILRRSGLAAETGATVRVFSSKKQQRDPANHAAPWKLPSPCLVARAGRKHLPVVAPTPPRRTDDVYPHKGPE